MANDSTRKSKPRRSTVRAVSRVKPAKHSDIAAIVQSVAGMGGQRAAAFAARYFKTGEGEYGAGDKFLGVRMPALRQFARTVGEAGLDVALPLLKSGWHEARALALLLMVRAYEKGDPRIREAVYRTYLRHTKFINNWDLVDLSAAPIVGAWLADKPKERKSVLTRLAKSKVLWERRIAILATHHSIRNGEATETFRIARLLLNDKEDLIHKAVGWMLREVGQRIGQDIEENFLKQVYREMPRTMLRYAIERLPEAKRKRYLLGLA
ncbi:MAG: DNA alkylation repair protein [Betaproteobacteria bacterium]|jgi:3-methyladenine DNA glycosylase AlkD|nr:DNA alkylation repair protein [Betaproteobacteria bacterium]